MATGFLSFSAWSWNCAHLPVHHNRRRRMRNDDSRVTNKGLYLTRLYLTKQTNDYFVAITTWHDAAATTTITTARDTTELLSKLLCDQQRLRCSSTQ